ncbi:DUF5085 family protein [Bacillus aquiflavi]|uniref:DUF5085 family protein n=1 Tax=Bacillus aquiflavi TaxID=2672567 RepID=A0A6B3VUI1_9BACI|nr:DUF5085 family protein [Bacillus aquiflavi]MBA4535591.1 DUF5085 family protein [Bacillus aquiflavi]NEY79967.1 DUF5085 family protein [Bacillus aquiflavi]UAC48909.1 DUF5085 family protein [Bacillus aquiflavi]
MINPNDSIRYMNVVSKTYHFHYNDIDDIMKRFLTEVVQNTMIKGPLFYSINNVPMDEMVNAEFFMPIEEDHLELGNEMYFHSYYAVEDMLSICLYDQFEKHTEVAYHMLLEYMEQNDLTQTTPFFHVISGDETLQYVFIKVGVYKKNEN